MAENTSSASLSALSAGTKSVSSLAQKYKETKDLELQAAQAKSQRVEAYKKATLSNIAQQSASGFTGEGTSAAINDANLSSYQEDVETIETELDSKKDSLLVSGVLDTVATGTETYLDINQKTKIKDKAITDLGEDNL